MKGAGLVKLRFELPATDTGCRLHTHFPNIDTRSGVVPPPPTHPGSPWESV